MIEANPQQVRNDWLVQGRCAGCGGLPHDVHEILAGANRRAAYREPACWLRVCRVCHMEIQGRPIEEQLAIKLLTDPEHYDLARVCRVWGRPLSAINMPLLHELFYHEYKTGWWRA